MVEYESIAPNISELLILFSEIPSYFFYTLWVLDVVWIANILIFFTWPTRTYSLRRASSFLDIWESWMTSLKALLYSCDEVIKYKLYNIHNFF